MKSIFILLLGACVVCAREWKVEKIVDGLMFTEGPVWKDDGLIFSDVRGDTLYRWTEKDGFKIFRESSKQANGNTLGPEGRLITCRHEARDVVRMESDGALTVLVSTHAGGKLNSPNDVVMQADGTLWFTDPPYGLKKRPKEQPFNAVYRLDPGATELVAVVMNLSYPNGVAFSPDGNSLYITESDSRIKPNFVMRYAVNKDKSLEKGERFVTVKMGAADGLCIDVDGRLFCTSGIGVEIFNPTGERIGVIRTPKPASNCCFGGEDGKTLFITAGTAVYRTVLNP